MAKKQVIEKNYRPPIVTIMGHVDHGKTTLLDTIRKSNVVKGESGGITQHIGAYTVEKDGSEITFIDTPGHEAFSAMRSRGGSIADIIILVVAANDGVMPQTKEAIMHAKSANVPIIVAINKMDMPGADVNKVKKQLSQNDILVEGYGGDIVTVEVSALKGTNIDQLLEVINLIVEMDKDKYLINETDSLQGVVIESKKDPKKGVMVSVIVKKGVLSIGDEVVAAGIDGKVKALSTWNKTGVKIINPGEAGEVLGFSDVPSVGSIVHLKSDESLGEEKITEADNTQVFEDASTKVLNLVVRADTVGTEEAIVASLKKLSLDEAKVNILLSGIGPVKESDVLLASSGRAIILAFKVPVSDSVQRLADSNKIIIREHDIIYKLLEEIEGALEGVIEIEEAKIKGRGLVIETFTLPKSGDLIAGVLIEAGKFKVNQRVGVFRGEHEAPELVARIKSIHIGKLEVEVAKKGEECGLLFKTEVKDIQLDDRIEVL